jgi:hypothetical protein
MGFLGATCIPTFCRFDGSSLTQQRIGVPASGATRLAWRPETKLQSVTAGKSLRIEPVVFFYSLSALLDWVNNRRFRCDLSVVL